MAKSAMASKLARDWEVAVRKADSGEEDEFVVVNGINSLQPALDPNLEDSTDFGNDGWSSQEKTLQGWSLAIGYIEKFFVGEDKEDDPGQKILEEASDKFGDASQLEVQWYERNGGERAYQGFATVQYEPQGGGPADLSTVNVTLQGNGARTRIENPKA